MGKVCSWCGKAIPRGTVHSCPRRPKREKDSRDARRADLRRSNETWRKEYGEAYKRVRDAQIRAAGGKCEACGQVVFVSTVRGWKKLNRDFGATHHLVPLSAGGTNAPENIAVLCARCHGIAHSRAFADARKRLGDDVAKGALLSLIRRLAS